jgi:guanylate kinase
MSASPAGRRGNLFVIAAPSGAGKTSLVKAALAREPRLRVSVSHTTRARRPTETDGQDYFFVDVQKFEQLIAAGEFLEYARVFDNFYGTGRTQVDRLRRDGFDVILEIDWQGARQVRAALPECHAVFVLPPSRRTLEERLRNRKTDSDAVIARRLRDAVADMSHYREFDAVIVNDDFATAVGELLAWLRQPEARLAATRPELAPLIAELLGTDSGFDTTIAGPPA